MVAIKTAKRHYLIASDFDQTLSFNDSGSVLAAMLGISGFEEKTAGLAQKNFVQQGAELAYLIRHDPDFRRVRREDLVAAGKQVRLKENVHLLPQTLESLSEEGRFHFYVISAGPQEVVESALEGIVPPDHIFGTLFGYDSTGEIQSIVRSTAGYGKVVVLNQLRAQLGITQNRLIYVGDGSSDIHVMLHVNRLDGLTIAVSENPYIKQVARRIVLSDDAHSILIPILEEILGWDSAKIRTTLETRGFLIREWDKHQMDVLSLQEAE